MSNQEGWGQHRSDKEEEEDEDDEKDEEPKVCQVCGDRATGYHFNAMTCEGCKGFFRRAMKRPVMFSCPFQNTCVITKSNRRQCQACRLRKCKEIGMLKELIMSDEAVEKRRMLIRVKRTQAVPVQLMPEQEAVIQELLEAQRRTFDITFSCFKRFRPIDRNIAPMHEYSNSPHDHSSSSEPHLGFSYHPRDASLSPSSSTSKERQTSVEECGQGKTFSTLPHVADLTTYMIQHIIDFAKILPSFRKLSIEDQISLLKGATFEVCQIRFNMLFNEKTGIWECGHLTYCMDDAARAGFQPHLLDPLMKFHYTLRNLKLHESEYVLMQAISLFSPDRPGVTQHSEIDRHQEMLALTLKTYIDTKRTSTERYLLYPKIMACLTEMRTMNEEYTKQVLQIQDIQPDVSPLMMEVVRKDT